jgi:CubicO group peptidase (beta-lactamase class C family)
MNNIWVKTICLVCLFNFMASAIKCQTNQYQQTFDKAKNAGFSGVALVAENGKTVFYQAAGKRRYENNTDLVKTDIFELASVSKQFTAMIIMMLKERELLQYDDPIDKYLQLPYKNITIRHLLTHTSGLPDYQDMMDKHWDKTKVAGNPDILAYLNQYAPPIEFAAGEKYAYSNTGYVLLASIAEKASGKDFIELCRTWIFKPLKMRHTDMRTLEAKAKVKNFAVGHLLDSTNKYVNANRFRASDYTVWLGNRKGPGRISSTAADLLKWDAALYAEKLVKKATLEEAFTGAKLNNGKLTNYGFGWEVLTDKSGKKYVQHTGDNPGYRTIIIRLLETHKTVIILNNNAHDSMLDLFTGLQQ